VCVCERERERVKSGGEGAGGGVKSKVRGVKKYHKGLGGRPPAFSQDLV